MLKKPLFNRLAFVVSSVQDETMRNFLNAACVESKMSVLLCNHARLLKPKTIFSRRELDKIHSHITILTLEDSEVNVSVKPEIEALELS